MWPFSSISEQDRKIAQTVMNDMQSVLGVADDFGDSSEGSAKLPDPASPSVDVAPRLYSDVVQTANALPEPPTTDMEASVLAPTGDAGLSGDISDKEKARIIAIAVAYYYSVK